MEARRSSETTVITRAKWHNISEDGIHLTANIPIKIVLYHILVIPYKLIHFFSYLKWTSHAVAKAVICRSPTAATRVRAH
jgi:hypothetical protein